MRSVPKAAASVMLCSGVRLRLNGSTVGRATSPPTQTASAGRANAHLVDADSSKTLASGHLAVRSLAPELRPEQVRTELLEVDLGSVSTGIEQLDQVS
jgi:hypothetical protein